VSVPEVTVLAGTASRLVVTCTWQEVPHLSPPVQATLLASIPPYQRDARSKGVPSLGSGAVYQIPESDIKVPDFEIPNHWPRAWGLDTGWNWTAVAWGAIDRQTQTFYVYSVYKRGNAELPIHVDAIKSRGDWIPGVGDAAALHSKDDGQQTIDLYRRYGLDIQLPDKAVETGIYELWTAMAAGKFKVFASCGAWFDEYRLYRRNEKGVIIKVNEHLMDGTRYLYRSGRDRAKPVPPPVTHEKYSDRGGAGSLDWMYR
jgi:hypothetical protein